jgi:hypothetical protein
MTRRAQDEVDLTYITPRTIAMSFPATGYEGERTLIFGFFLIFDIAYLSQSLIATTLTTLLHCYGEPMRAKKKKKKSF